MARSGLGVLANGDKPPVMGDALADQAYRLLRNAILGHRLPAGTRLSVPDVARQLGISRSPAREAIARVAAEGLATVEPRRGAVVARITVADLIEIYELREVLEGLACRMAAQHATDDDLRTLRECVGQHRDAIETADIDRHMSLDQSFHATIRRIAGNSRLQESLGRLQGQIRIAMDTTRLSPGGMPQALAEHAEILTALEAGDPSAAEAAARSHIARLRKGLQNQTG